MQKNWRQYGEGGKNRWRNQTEKDSEDKAVSYTHLRAHETPEHLVCRLLLEKKKNTTKEQIQ